MLRAVFAARLASASSRARKCLEDATPDKRSHCARPGPNGGYLAALTLMDGQNDDRAIALGSGHVRHGTGRTNYAAMIVTSAMQEAAQRRTRVLFE